MSLLIIPCCPQDYRRRYNLEPLVKSTEDEELAKGRKRATVSAENEKLSGVFHLSFNNIQMGLVLAQAGIL